MIEIKQEIKEILKNIGLDRAESQVCILLLEKNLQSIGEISKHIKLPRSSVHLACENLLTKGVLKISITGKRRNFYIENPKAILNFIEKEENILQAKKIQLNNILPKLISMFAQSQDSEPIDIEELKGEDGFVETFYKSLNQPKGSEVLRFGGDPELFTIERDKLKKYREDRMKKKIFTKLLQPKYEHSDFEIEDSKFKMREVRVLDKSIYNPKLNASIWQEYTAITIWDKGLHSVIIRNKAIADFMKQMFEIAWEKGKK